MRVNKRNDNVEPLARSKIIAHNAPKQSRIPTEAIYDPISLLESLLMLE